MPSKRRITDVFGQVSGSLVAFKFNGSNHKLEAWAEGKLEAYPTVIGKLEAYPTRKLEAYPTTS